MTDLIRAMSDPGFYPDSCDRVEVRETHTAWVFLAGDYAYKLKKPIRLPFIDCSTPARRRELCEHEVALNRRLAPDVYLGVISVLFDGVNYSFDSARSHQSLAADFAVKMKRLPDDRRLDYLIAAGKLSADAPRTIARHLAEFHRRTAADQAWTYGSAAAVWQLVTGNLNEARDLAEGAAEQNRLAAIDDFNKHYVSNHWEFFNQRAHRGYVRDGHGDLRADAIYLLDDGIRIIDALEFSEGLRYGDVASEIAFLAMDLDRLGKPDYAEQLVRAYVEAAGDTDIRILMRFYKCHRAMVRAKVELIRSRQHQADPERAAARTNADRYLELGLSYSRQLAPRALIAVCGLSGTGKSTLARELHEELRLEILSSDAERKRLAGIGATARSAAAYGEGIYSEARTREVYRSLIAKAEARLKSNAGVIIDATFQRREQRAVVIDLATRLGVSPIFVECRAEQDEVIRRLTERSQNAAEVSDATVEIYLEQSRAFEPLTEIPPLWHVVFERGTALGFQSPLLAVERHIFSRD